MTLEVSLDRLGVGRILFFTRDGAFCLTNLDGNKFTDPVNMDQLKKFYA